MKKNKILYYISIASSVILLFIFTAVTAAWLTNNALTGGAGIAKKFRQEIIDASRFPSLARDAIINLKIFNITVNTTLLIPKKEVEKSTWTRKFPAAEDSGYLLLSGVDRKSGMSSVSLIQIADGTIIHKWEPDWLSIIKKTTYTKNSIAGIHPSEMRAFHPLLLNDGTLIFNTGGALVSMGICNQKTNWILNEIAHHSVEVDNNGDIWTISYENKSFPQNYYLNDRVKEDAIAKIDKNGNLISRFSFAKILIENGYTSLFMGVNWSEFQKDPIHLNQISIASESGKYWAKGDLLISARHLSTVFLYRPSSRKIIWSKTGPWMGQHSVTFLGNHRISVFDNNVYAGAPKEQPFINSDDNNRFIIYDFETKKTYQPYEKLLQRERPVTITEGRGQVLEDGGLFIEETNQGRHLRFSKDKLIWSRVNDYDEDYIGTVSWSRYLSLNEVTESINSINKSKSNCVR